MRRLSFILPAACLLTLLVLPMGALLVSAPDLEAGLDSRLLWPAVQLSVKTSLISLLLIVLSGTPLAWWLSRRQTRIAAVVSALVELPVVVPPAVVGIALLETFGRTGLLGPTLSGLGIVLPFTTAAVVVAQVVVAAPLYVSAATGAFRTVDPDLLLVAQTLGTSRAAAIRRVAAPLALPGLLAGAALSWARALGEFGATLLFAGSLPGVTQTMPLAIYAALESDVTVALALSLLLAGAALLSLLVLRGLPALWMARR
ncbi:MAG: molybdate transport system permease protein [Myxococcota bacterium]|jgi:molybdate transport system permease protein